MDLASIVGGAVGAGSAPDSGFGAIGKAIGNMLTGGGASGQQAYMQGANAGLSLQIKQLQARKARDEAVARDNTFAKLSAAFPDMEPAMIELAANTMVGGMGSDFNSTMSGLGRAQENQLQMRAADESDPLVANQILSALNKKPNDLTQISGGTAYNPMVAPGDQSLVMTPDALADNARDALVDQSQITANEARAARSLRPGAANGKPVRDPIADYASRQNIDQINRDYRLRIAAAKTPAQKTELDRQRQTEIDRVVQSSQGGATDASINLAGSDAAAIADQIEAADGVRLSQAQRESIARQMAATGGEFRLDLPSDAGPDGRDPPQVLDPSSGKPVTGGRTDKPGNARQDVATALLGPALDFVNGGYAGASPAKPDTARGDSIPQAAASKLREGVETTFGNGQTWTKRNGIPVRVK